MYAYINKLVYICPIYMYKACIYKITFPYMYVYIHAYIYLLLLQNGYM